MRTQILNCWKARRFQLQKREKRDHRKERTGGRKREGEEGGKRKKRGESEDALRAPIPLRSAFQPFGEKKKKKGEKQGEKGRALSDWPKSPHYVLFTIFLPGERKGEKKGKRRKEGGGASIQSAPVGRYFATFSGSMTAIGGGTECGKKKEEERREGGGERTAEPWAPTSADLPTGPSVSEGRERRGGEGRRSVGQSQQIEANLSSRVPREGKKKKKRRKKKKKKGHADGGTVI